MGILNKTFKNNDVLDARELNEMVDVINYLGDSAEYLVADVTFSGGKVNVMRGGETVSTPMPVATDQNSGYMSIDDHRKLSGINQEETIKLIKGTSENSSAMEYPRVYKEYQRSQYDDPVAEAMAHMDSIGNTTSGSQESKNVGVTVLNVNGNCWRLHTFVQSYASQVYAQKIEGTLQWNGTRFESSTDYHEYTRKRTSAGWGEWKDAMSGSDVDLSNANDINVASTHPGDISPDGASIVVREANRMGEGSGTVYNSQAPRIGFNWKGRWWAQILMVSNVFKFVRGKDDTNWAGIQAGTIQGTAIKTTGGADLDNLKARVEALEAKLYS